MKLTVCLIFLPLFAGAQVTRPEMKSLVDSIARFQQMDEMYIANPGFKQERYATLYRLTEIATTGELLALMQSPDTKIRCVAFKSLCAQDSVDIIPLMMERLYDTSLVGLQMGCIGYSQMAGDYCLQAFDYYSALKGMDYLMSNQARILRVDSMVKYDPAIRLQAKINWIKNVNGDTVYYERIREIAAKEGIPEAVLALAKYKKQEDREIIAGYFSNKATWYHAVWAVREFPDSSFYPLLLDVFKKQWKQKRYAYTTWRILYQALAQYPTAATLELFDKTLSARNRYRRQTLGGCLNIAIAKYPHPLFDRYKGRIEPGALEQSVFTEEMNAER